MSGDPPEGGPDDGTGDETSPDGVDPFEGLVLDESFVRSARLHEAPAEQRHSIRPSRPTGSSHPSHPARPRPPSGALPPSAPRQFDPEDDRSRRLARPSADDEWAGSALRRRRHSTVLRRVAVLLVASMVVVYAISHLATLWGRPPTVEGSMVRTEQTVSADEVAGGPLLVRSG